jgi:uncharacterized integral membrane protein (TIGR00698 family)
MSRTPANAPADPLAEDSAAGTPVQDLSAAAPAAPESQTPDRRHTALGIWPGLLICAAVGAGCLWLGTAVPNLSPMLAAIVLGILLRNTVPIPGWAEPGIAVSAKSLLRWGVVLLGLQLSLPAIVALGPGVLLIVVFAVGITFFTTLGVGRLLGVDRDLRTLIAAGFSICGAAAVAGMQGALRATQEKVAAAVALVVLFGTLMIPVTDGLVALFGLGTGDAGTLIGGSVHEVAQVVAAAGIAGGAPLLAVAVPIKLARVVLMAPVVGGMSAWRRHSTAPVEGAKRPPLLPLFVLGFIAMMLVATTGLVPGAVLDVAKVIQQFLLAAAMFALGLGVSIRSLIHLGARPILLGLAATVTIMLVVGAGILLGAGAQG